MGIGPRLVRIAAGLLVLTACAAPQRDPAPAQMPLADSSDRAVATAIDAITTFPTELDPRIWDGTAMRQDVRSMTLKVVDRVVATSGIAGLTVDSVELFGSNASYEYDDASDFGVHVFVHSTTLSPAQLDGVLRLLNDDVERRQEGHITFNGVPLELTFHGERGASYRAQPGIGQYSVSAGSWIEMPTQQPDRFDRAQMDKDLRMFIGAYNDLVKAYTANKKGFDCARFGALDTRLGDYRNSGFANGFGSRSTQNLTFRALRRLNVSIPHMLDVLEDECVFVNESIG
jgi:hypothetical protein